MQQLSGKGRKQVEARSALEVLHKLRQLLQGLPGELVALRQAQLHQVRRRLEDAPAKGDIFYFLILES